MVGPESFQPEASVKSLRSPSGRERSGRRRLRGGHRRSKSEGQKGKQELFSRDGAQRSSIRWTPAGWPGPTRKPVFARMLLGARAPPATQCGNLGFGVNEFLGVRSVI